jgi:CheY-like chemotaxis protein
LVVLMLMTGLLLSRTTAAQDATENAEEDTADPTVAALQTQVAELEATVEARDETIQAQQTQSAATEAGPTAMAMPVPETESGDPIPISPELEVAYYHLFASGSDLKASGEIVNVTDDPVQVPNILFQFLDEDGLVLGEDEAEPMSYWVGPQQRMPFTAHSLLGGALLPGDWASVNVLAGEPGYFADETYSLDLVLVDVEETGAVGEEAAGKIQNNGQTPVGPVVIAIAYFDKEGVFLGHCSGDYLDLEIQPGRAARFSVYTSGGCGNISDALDGMEDAGQLATYRLIISVSPF